MHSYISFLYHFIGFSKYKISSSTSIILDTLEEIMNIWVVNVNRACTRRKYVSWTEAEGEKSSRLKFLDAIKQTEAHLLTYKEVPSTTCELEHLRG